MVSIANKYYIPSINLRVEVARLEMAAELTMKSGLPIAGQIWFLMNGVHLGLPINWGGTHGEMRESVIPEIIGFEDALHFVWSLPVSATTLGRTNVQQVKEDIKYLQSFAGMSESNERS